MTLISCHDCEKKVSSQAKACPNCGARLKPRSIVVIIKVICGLALLLVVIFAIWSIATPEYEKEAIAARSACLQIIDITNQPNLKSQCDVDFASAMIKGEMSSSYYKSETNVGQTSDQDKQKMNEDYKSDCLQNKEKFITSVRTKKGKDIDYLDANKIERCAELTSDNDYINLLGLIKNSNATSN
jgi:hypothetical protein